MRHFLFLAAVAIPVTAAQAAEVQKVRLHVYGAYCAGCAGTLTETLAQGGVKNVSKVAPNRGRGYVIVLGEIEDGSDLAALADVVNQAETPHKKQAAPGLALELMADLDESSAEAALEALGKLPGVDAEGSKADPKSGTISVRLTGKEPVTVAAIVGSLQGAGVAARIETE